MAVVSVNERIEERRSEQDWRGRKHMRPYIVVCDDKTDNTKSVLTASANGHFIPNVGERYTEVDEFSWLVRKHAAPYDNQPHTFRVICEYSSRPEHAFSPRSHDVHLLRSRLHLSSAVRDEPMQYDMDGVLVANSAGVPFDPPISRNIPPDYIITHTHNYGRIGRDAFFVDDYANRLNSDAFLGVNPGNAKIGRVDADYLVDGNTPYWSVTFEFQFKLDEHGFEPPVVDKGFQELVTVPNEDGTTTIRRVEMSDKTYGLDKDGKAVETGIATVSSPQLLDGHGKRIPPAASADEPMPEAVNLWFRRHDTFRFAALGVEGEIRRAAAGGLI